MTPSFMPHQTDVLKQTEPFNKVAYYLDMGLGKTFVGAEKLWELNSPVNLVVCQKSKIDDWVEHFTEYYGESFKVYDLTKKSSSVSFRTHVDTLNIYDDSTNPDIIGVINYDLLFRRDWYKGLKNFTLMLDESQLIANETAKRSKFILKMQPDNVILLSGTPTSGRYEKLWSQCCLLGWNITKKAFWKSYIETEWVEEGEFKHEVVTGYKNVNHLKKKLAEHGAVFMKTNDVLTLPEQVEQKIKVSTTKEYKHFMKNGYVQFSGKLLATTHCNGDEDFYEVVELVGDNSLTKTLYARQLCGQYHKEKLQAFRDLVQSTEERLIVFYNFTAEYLAMVEVIQDLDRPQSIVNGKQKQLLNYENCSNSITFIQYQAGAMGGNYQKANKIVYFTLPLGQGSCDLWEQSKKRIHRIGQDRTCFYYYLIVKNSIEERNLAALKVGKELTDELFKKS